MDSLNGGSQPGLSLLDCVPVPTMVPITIKGGQGEIGVYGLSISDIATLLSRFPELMAMVTGAAQGQPVSWDAGSLLGACPLGVASILAAATGHASDDAHEAAASRLPADTQMDMLTAIIKATMPQGFGPFVEKLTAMFRTAIAETAAAEEPLSGVELVSRLVSLPKD